MPENDPVDSIYFNLKELGIILVLSILAAVSGALVPSYLFPEERISDIVYGILVLPGPGAGVLIFGGILCFWLLVGLILVKKPGTAVAMSMLLIAFDLLFGNQVSHYPVAGCPVHRGHHYRSSMPDPGWTRTLELHPAGFFCHAESDNPCPCFAWSGKTRGNRYPAGSISPVLLYFRHPGTLLCVHLLPVSGEVPCCSRSCQYVLHAAFLAFLG